MKKVFKYTLDFSDYPTAYLPKGAKIIKADEQNNSIRDSKMLYLWAVIDDEEKESEERKFRLAGTGHPLGDNLHLKPISCIFTEGGTYVWSIFEILP